jgi:hypothetical protein
MEIPASLARAIESHHAAAKEFRRGNAGPWKEHCSHADDVTIIGGWGGYEKGWKEEVKNRYEWAAAQFKGTNDNARFENVTLVVTPEMAYSVDIEHSEVKVDGTDSFRPLALRVTTIFRLENDEWKMVHRHADPYLKKQVPAAGS